jgi:plasmid stabilization system protein ParE
LLRIHLERADGKVASFLATQKDSSLQFPYSDDRSGVIVTLQREAGKTPHQMRAAAEASAAALRTEMQRLVQQLRAGADKWIAYTKRTDIEEDARARAYAYAESDRQSARMIDDVLYAASVDRACDSSAATAENKTDAG